ncbi:hypothetical protein BDV09DRAFT_74120 [Aspergillus tetrazonus]
MHEQGVCRATTSELRGEKSPRDYFSMSQLGQVVHFSSARTSNTQSATPSIQFIFGLLVLLLSAFDLFSERSVPTFDSSLPPPIKSPVPHRSLRSECASSSARS